MSEYELTIKADPDDLSSMKDLRAAVKSKDTAIVLFRITRHLPKEAENYEENDPSASKMKKFMLRRISDYLEEEGIDVDDITE